MYQEKIKISNPNLKRYYGCTGKGFTVDPQEF